MKKNKFKAFAAVILILCAAVALSMTVSAAGNTYTRQSKIVSGNSYLFVAENSRGDTAYSYGMSKNRGPVSIDGDHLSGESSLGDLEIQMESAGGSSYYLKNSNGDYLCLECVSTIVTVNKFDGNEWHEEENYISSERFSIIDSDKKLNNTTSSRSESVEGDTETIITTVKSYSPVWKIYGSGSFSFSASVTTAGTEHKRYLVASDTSLDVEEDKVVFSLFSRSNEYTVEFDANGGSGAPGSITVTDGQKVDEPDSDPKRDGYNFKGWSADKTGLYDFSDKVTEDITLYALWEPYTYTVNFNSNGGEGTMSSQTFRYGQYQRLDKNTFVREGFKFDGWAEAASGEAVYGNGESVRNLSNEDGGTVELFAVWEKAKDEDEEQEKPDADEPTDGKFTITIRYLDEKKKDIAYSEQRIVDDGEEYVIEPIEIDGYKPDKNEYKGVINGADVTVNVTYTAIESGSDIWWTIGVIVLALLCAGGITVLVIRYKQGKLHK
jgi:uncharacterized repeat protein (TIGR02543 family)